MTDTQTLSVNVPALLSFFDEKAPDSSGHASAVVAVGGEELGIALLAKYLNDVGAKVEVLPERCTQGTKKGSRLDGWVQVSKGGRALLYQVEVKNWSAHAIGGRRLPRTVSGSDLATFKRAEWARTWNGTTFRNPNVVKVLTPMRAPRNLPVEPLACFWTAMHPEGLAEPFFSVPISGADFTQVSVFSMSAYLRTLTTEAVVLDMPGTSRRLAWLDRLFRNSMGA